jgi:hypothetical protein
LDLRVEYFVDRLCGRGDAAAGRRGEGGEFRIWQVVFGAFLLRYGGGESASGAAVVTISAAMAIV